MVRKMIPLTPAHFFLSTIIIFTVVSPLSFASDTLTPGKPLRDGDTLTSAGNKFVLGFFTPPGSTYRYVGIWYYDISVQTVVWVANRNKPISDLSGALSVSSNGNLTIAANNYTVVWSATPTTSTVNNPIARILDTGNFVVKESSSSVFSWQSFDHPTDTLLTGMKLGWNLTSGLNRNLTSWTSYSNPASGPFTMTIDVRGDPQKILWSGSTPIWRTGPWVGGHFTGIPEMVRDKNTMFMYFANSEEVYFTYDVHDPSFISRLVMNQTGSYQRWVWLDQTETWNQFWFAPRDQCDRISHCGPNGVCNPNVSPSCSCLQGFKPKSPTNWDLRDSSDGCIRETPLDCVNRTDGFLTINEVKLPDTSTAVVNQAMSLDKCQATCLANCSCTGYAAVNISGGGSSCIMWSTGLSDLRLYTNDGEDIYVRLAAADLDFVHKRKRAGKSLVAVIIVLSSIIITSLALACIFCRKKKQRRAGATIELHKSYNFESGNQNDFKLPILDFNTVVAATDNFSDANKLGEGGFGPVFKGRLVDGQEIAVKKLGENSIQGVDEFKNEIMLISKVQHRNLVRLLGCCIHENDRMLIYEFMPNKSLDAFLFGRERKELLDWNTRYRIIIGIARGLSYLHHDSRFKIIHRDIKISNILLDHEMNPKISDFGMARICSEHTPNTRTVRVVGTYGYMSPEYAMDGIFSTKSDVFSFGVLVLEIITGKKNKGAYHSEPECYLLGHTWTLWKEGKGLELVDPSLGHSFSKSEVLKCMRLGLLCVQQNADDRPTMSSVVMILDSDDPPMQEPNAPGFIARSYYSSADSSLDHRQSVNNLTITAVGGR